MRVGGREVGRLGGGVVDEEVVLGSKVTVERALLWYTVQVLTIAGLLEG